VTALRDAEFTLPTESGPGVIDLTPRAGASPIHAVAGAALPLSIEPLSLDVPPERELLAEYVTTEIRTGIIEHGLAEIPADDFLLTVPRAPRECVGKDARMSYADDTIVVQLSRRASRAKSSQGPQWTIPLEAVESLSYMPASKTADQFGYVQLRLAEAPAGLHVHPAEDVNAMLLEGSEQHVNGLVFAAGLLERIRRTPTRPHPDLVSAWASGSGKGMRSKKGALHLLKELAQLRDSGILTEEEFQAKKRDLLNRL
jgi:hypothetical protein